MKLHHILSIALAALTAFAAAADDIAEASALAARLSPRLAEKVEFRHIDADNGADVFTLASEGDHVVIGGNSANSMAVGLNRYLNRHCLTTVGWYADQAVELPDRLPDVKAPERVTARVGKRFFLNYCTYGYTMAFWQWAEWERFIDWMALNGVNMPLAITGQEGVWRRVWTQMGMTDEEVRSYFTGPAYLPWHRMANIDGWCGPLPEQWLDTQIALQQKILARERSLNMRPVLPAFAGHVPGRLRELFPDADIKAMNLWAGFPEANRTYFLNSEDSLFTEIQRLYLKEQTALFGTDHIYGIDPFNEMDPPSFEPEYLNHVASHIYESLTAVDEEAEWLQMAWFLYYQRNYYTPERAKAMITGVPQGKMTLLDYYCEYKEMWRDLDSFFGQPFIWCYLGNFGGNSGIAGNVKEAVGRLETALDEAGDNLVGIGSTLEGLDVQQFPYEHILSKAWNFSDTDEEAIDLVADRHAGLSLPDVRRAWRAIYDSVLTFPPVNFCCPLPCTFPQMGKVPSGSQLRYNTESLEEAYRLLSQYGGLSTALTTDIVWAGRQLLGDSFADHKRSFDEAFTQRDAERMAAEADTMRTIIREMNTLNARLPHATLDKWLDDARAYGDTITLSDYYELNARRIITTWGGGLNDYACRNYSGLLVDYYLPRWEIYFEEALRAAKMGEPFNVENQRRKTEEFQNRWGKGKRR